jgi:hypothetical protein
MDSSTRLIELVKDLERLDQEATIYVEQPWECESEAIVAIETPNRKRLEVATEQGFKYFLEVSISRDLIADWETSLGKVATNRDRCERLIQYAINDA